MDLDVDNMLTMMDDLVNEYKKNNPVIVDIAPKDGYSGIEIVTLDGIDVVLTGKMRDDRNVVASHIANYGGRVINKVPKRFEEGEVCVVAADEDYAAYTNMLNDHTGGIFPTHLLTSKLQDAHEAGVPIFSESMLYKYIEGR